MTIDTAAPATMEPLDEVFAREIVPVTMSTGEVIHANLETLADLQAKLGDAISQAYEVRQAERSAYLSPDRFGLTRVDSDGAVPQWIHPDGYGQMPYGVPVVSFFSGSVTQYRWRRSAVAENAEESWRLTFHQRPDVVLGEVPWHDSDGLARLANTLMTVPAEDLVVEAALLHRGSDDHTSRYWANAAPKLSSLLTRAAGLPAVDDDVTAAAAAALSTTTNPVRLTPVTLLDPTLCRLVALPGLLALRGFHGSAPEADKALRRVGLAGVATRSQSLRYHGITRLAVANTTARRTVGTLKSHEVDFIATYSQNAQQVATWRSRSNTMALNPTALTLDEWENLH